MAATIPTGTTGTKLIVIRGNPGSGKSTIARRLRAGYGRGCALVEQDYLRRVLLRERDAPGGLAIGLIEQTVRYALDGGCHVILDGILHRAKYGPMLTTLMTAHVGNDDFGVPRHQSRGDVAPAQPAPASGRVHPGPDAWLVSTS